MDVISMTPLNQQGQGRIGAQLNEPQRGRTFNPGGDSYTLGEFQNLLEQTVAGYGGLITNTGHAKVG